MTTLEEDLKKVDDSLVKLVDSVGKKLFGKTKTEAFNTHTCISCDKPAVEFEDDISAAEWRISGLCQECQLFEED